MTMTDTIDLLASSSSSSEDDEAICNNTKTNKRKRMDVVAPSRYDLDLSTSSDDDEEDFAIPSSSVFSSSKQGTATMLSKTQRQDNKPQEKNGKSERERRKEEKQMEKEEKQAARQREKEERAMTIAATKQAKTDRKIAAQQKMGKFAKDEIGVLVDPKLLKDPEWKETFDTFYESYDSVVESEGVDEGAIQFIRRDHVEGGATAALRALEKSSPDGFQLVHHLVIVFSDPSYFLAMMERSETEDDYPKLEAWLEEKCALWKNKWSRSESPRVMILLPGVMDEVHRQWNNPSKKDKEFLMTDADINDAIVWLQVAFRVESQLMKSKEDVLDFLIKMTRSISEEPYARQSTELECVRKIKSSLEGQNHSPLEIAQDTWIRMLQQVPTLSATRAETLAQYYPTARSLWQAYVTTKEESGKKMLVAHLMSEKRQYRKLSEFLHRLMTSQDSKDFLI